MSDIEDFNEWKEIRQNTPWHLDKKFALSIIFSIFLNSGAFIWYGAKLDSNVQQNISDIVGLKIWKEKQTEDFRNFGERISHIETKTDDEVQTLNRIELILGNSRVYRKRDESQ